MKKEITYIAGDGTRFLTEEGCLAYENEQKVPEGVYLYTNQMKPITSGSAFDDVYRMYIVTEEGFKWVCRKCEEFGLAKEGLVIGKHLYYGDVDIWLNFEDDIADYKEKITMACDEIDRYKV